MHGFSTADGFVEISESLAEMIKYVANEPSVGLFFIQKHTQNAVPNVVKLKKNVIEKSRETTLHTEDLEDSVTMVRSMKECGFPIVDEMIGDIKKSLVTITSKQPKKELIHQSSSNLQTERASFWGNSAIDVQEGSEKKGYYFSNVFKFSKQKEEKAEKYTNNVPLLVKSGSTSMSSQGMEAHMLPQVEDECQVEQSSNTDIGVKLLSVLEKYDDFKACKEAKLEEWLGETSNHDDQNRP